MRHFLTACAVALTVVVGAPAVSNADATLAGKSLLQEVAKGGYVIFMRHTSTNNDQKDTDTTDLSNCATQRNLSDEGRQEAKMIADGLKAHGVAIATVLSSPYCRAMESATIMFGNATKADELRFLTRLGPDEATAATDWLKKQLATAPASGSNVLLMSHTANLKEAAGIWPKNSGDFVVFKANGDGSFTHVGTIGPDEWSALMG